MNGRVLVPNRQYNRPDPVLRPRGDGTTSFTLTEPKVPGRLRRNDANFSIVNNTGNPELNLKQVPVDQALLVGVYSAPACKVAGYDDLSSDQQRLIGSDAAYNGLTDLQRSVFVNVTGQLSKAGVSLDGLQLQKGGVKDDRLFFASGSTRGFQASVQTAADGPAKSFNISGGVIKLIEKSTGNHAGMDDFLARQNVNLNAVQVGTGKEGGFGDIDLFTGRKHTFREVPFNSGPPKRITPHYYLSYVLGNCRN